MEITEISVQEVDQKIKNGDDFQLIDVRNEEEREFCHIGGTFIPLPELETRFEEISKDKEVIVYCRSGGRSLGAAQFLKSKGYADPKNMTGGILAWSDSVDSNIPKY